MFEITVETDFAAAHQLRGYQGKCENLHGHNWKVAVTVRGEKLNDLGMLVDFKNLKRHTADLMAELDHKFLNELPLFRNANPTTENIARHLFEQLQARMPEGLEVARVSVWESDRCRATYRQKP